MKFETLEDIFHHELSDIYNAEKQLTKALPKMAKAAEDPQLSRAFSSHLSETEKQVARLEKVFSLCDLKPRREKCDAMEGLIAEGKEVIDSVPRGPLLDTALIVAAQKVEHYEISGYGSLCALARQLGFDKAADLLETTLEEEKSADSKLNDLALGGINEEARAIAA